MGMRQTVSRRANYLVNSGLAKRMQPLAISQVYSQVWPDATVEQLDIESRNRLAVILDKSGADKLLRFHNGTIAFLAQRFRRWEYHNEKDWTIRETELNKAIFALQNGHFWTSYYAYGVTNHNETDFIKFYMFRYKEALEFFIPKIQRRYYPLIPNKDGGPGFVALPFRDIPDDLFLYRRPPKAYQLGLFTTGGK